MVIAESPAGTAALRNVLGRFVTGVTALLSGGPDADCPAALVANSFTSVSLNPPLVSVCVALTSTSWSCIRAAGRLSINILSDGQRITCDQLARHGPDKSRGIALSTTSMGTPVLCGALAWLECSVWQEHLAGDHTLVILRVHDHAVIDDGRPLIFFGGSYGRLSSADTRLPGVGRNRPPLAIDAECPR